jgi:predicted GTPase
MTTYQQQKQQVLQLLEDAIAFANAPEYSERKKFLKIAQQHLAEEKLYVLICGEFKRGKSSLINAFLDETNLFPVDVDITTNQVSTITYGETEKITVILGDVGAENGEARSITRAEIPEYVTEQRNHSNSKKTRMLVIEAPNPQLKEGLVLVDTPGTGSLNTEHTAVTYSFIPNADVIIFVSDASAPLKVEELNFIQERIIPHCQNLIFVVTKIDAITNYQSIVDSNREKLAKILTRAPKEIQIIPVSSSAKQDYLKFKDPEDLEMSHFPELQQQVWKLVQENRGQILLLKALSELGRSLTQIKRPLEVEWQAYQQRSQEELERWEQDIKKTQKQLQELLQSNADWQVQLRDGLETIKIDIQNEFQNGFIQCQRQSSKYLEDSRFLDEPQQIATLLEADIDGMMIALSKKLNAKAANLYSELENNSGLNFNSFAGSSFTPERAHFAVEDIKVQPTSVVDKAMTVGRTGMWNTGAGAFVGGLFGAVAGGVVGLFAGGVGAIPGAIAGAHMGASIGSIAGAAKGTVEGIQQIPKQDRELLKREVAKILKQYLEDSQRLCFQGFNKIIKSLERSLRDELTNQIKRQKESYDRSLQSLQDSRKLSQAQGQKRASELLPPLQKLTQMQRDTEKLAIDLTSQTAQSHAIPKHSQPSTSATLNR